MEKDNAVLGRKIGYGLFAVNSLVWLVFLFKIKTISLPVNCGGAWPDETVFYAGFIILWFFVIVAVENKYYHIYSMYPDFRNFMLSYIIIMLSWLLYSFVGALCMCSNPEIIRRTYLEASLVLIFDSIAKASVVSGLAAESLEKSREKNKSDE